MCKLYSVNLYRHNNLISFFKLIPSYRGFIIDTLSELNVFDDQSISKDERFKYFNMKSQPGKLKNI